VDKFGAFFSGEQSLAPFSSGKSLAPFSSGKSLAPFSSGKRWRLFPGGKTRRKQRIHENFRTHAKGHISGLIQEKYSVGMEDRTLRIAKV
jgi:hypothetical protein